MSSSPEAQPQAEAKAEADLEPNSKPDLNPEPSSKSDPSLADSGDAREELKQTDADKDEGKAGEEEEKEAKETNGGPDEKDDDRRNGDERRRGDEAEEGRDRKERKKDKKDKKERKERKERRQRSRSRSVERHRGSRDLDRDDRRRDRGRDRDRDRRDRDRHRDRERDYKRRTRSRSRSRDKRRRSPRRSRSHDDYRRSGRSRRSRSDSADYGGYVPRKRADTRRPPPDAPFSASMGVHNFSKAPSVTQQWPGAPSITPAPAAVDPAEALRRLQEQQLKARQLVLQQQAASAAAAASKTQREVYVGNLAMGIVTEEVLRTLFNNTLRAAFPAECAGGMEPVVNVNMHSDGRYSFVEMRTPEMATEALKISGLNLLGMPISCGRPSGYVDPAAVAAQAAEAARALQLFQAGGAAPGATAAMPATILPGPPALPAGVTLPGPPALPAGAAAPVPTPALAPTPEVPTTVICVENMFTESVLMDNEEYVEVMQDLQDECSKMGNVTDVKVPKPPGPGMYGQDNYGKAYVAFSEPSQASSAKALLDGRSFDGQVLRVTYVAAVPS